MTGVLLLAASAACSSPARDPFQLEGNNLTLENQTDEEWRSVEIWLNNYYRVIVPSIAAHGRFQVQLDSFVSGYAQRFDYRRAQITDLRLTAKRPTGESMELKKNFRESDPLVEAFGGKK